MDFVNKHYFKSQQAFAIIFKELYRPYKFKSSNNYMSLNNGSVLLCIAMVTKVSRSKLRFKIGRYLDPAISQKVQKLGLYIIPGMWIEYQKEIMSF